MLSRRLCFLLAALTLIAGCSSAPDRGDLSGARQEVVLNAIAQIGAPYRYGGASPNEGFDCSGLVQYAYRAAGIRVPRMTEQQKKAARHVGRTGPRPGDLLFFRIGWGSYHVGIMVDEGRFVHAPSSGKRVQIASLDNPYWHRRFSGAGTFIN